MLVVGSVSHRVGVAGVSSTSEGTQASLSINYRVHKGVKFQCQFRPVSKHPVRFLLDLGAVRVGSV